MCKMFNMSSGSTCSDDIDVFETLPSNIKCRMSSQCMITECCMEITEIGQSFRLKMNLDHCNYWLTFEIENFKYEVLLFDFGYGQEHNVSLFGVINVW